MTGGGGIPILPEEDIEGGGGTKPADDGGGGTKPAEPGGGGTKPEDPGGGGTKPEADEGGGGTKPEADEGGGGTPDEFVVVVSIVVVIVGLETVVDEDSNSFILLSITSCMVTNED